MILEIKYNVCFSLGMTEGYVGIQVSYHFVHHFFVYHGFLQLSRQREDCVSN